MQQQKVVPLQKDWVAFYFSIKEEGNLMGKKSIITDGNKRELNMITDGKFPLAVYYERLSNFAHGICGYHWHPELEVIIAVEGGMQCQVDGTLYEIAEGNGMFINTNKLHSLWQIKGQECVYRVVRFLPVAVGGLEGGRIYDKYVSSVLSDKNIPFLFLNEKEEWKREVRDLFRDIIEIYDKRNICNELDMLSSLFKAWHLLYENNQEHYEEYDVRTKDVERMKLGMLYVQEHHAEKITLLDIARACTVSKSECCRLFQKILGQSPIEYAMSYRIDRSLTYIAQDKYSMSEIAQMTGFSSSSYFTEIFRRLTGVTPSAYKKQLLENQE